MVEATFKLVFAFFIFPGSQEAAATHGREYVTFVVFAHFFSADIVRIHTFRTAFYSQAGNVIVFATFQAVNFVENINQFGERRSNIYAFVVFNTLQALTQNFFYDHCSFFQIRVVLFQMEEQGNERRLTIGGHQSVDLVLNGLYTTLQFCTQTFLYQAFQGFFVNFAMGRFQNITFEFIVATAQVFTQVADVYGLTAVLAGSYGRNDLGHNGAGNLEALGAFNHLAIHNGAFVQHIADVDKAAVKNRLNEIVSVMEVQYAFVMSSRDFFRQNDTSGQVFRNFASNQVTLGCCHNCVFIGVFFHYIFITITDQGQDGFVSGVGFTNQSTFVAVNDVLFCQFKFTSVHQAMFHDVLDIFYKQAHSVARLYIFSNLQNFIFFNSILRFNNSICLLNSDNNFTAVEINGGTIAFNNFHNPNSSFLNISKHTKTKHPLCFLQIKFYHNISCISRSQTTIYSKNFQKLCLRHCCKNS